ncbi:MAG: hypothetical protein HQL66_06085 [Magnetococcales bacterium]|nr:hypothetical protein [Magnetococcales bacterium]
MGNEIEHGFSRQPVDRSAARRLRSDWNHGRAILCQQPSIGKEPYCPKAANSEIYYVTTFNTLQIDTSAREHARKIGFVMVAQDGRHAPEEVSFQFRIKRPLHQVALHAPCRPGRICPVVDVAALWSF